MFLDDFREGMKRLRIVDDFTVTALDSPEEIRE
jgi:hypothetical protein